MTKQYKLIPVKNLYKIVWEGGGEIPKALKGLWPSQRRAKAAITLYETNAKRKTTASQKKREVKDGAEKDDD
jgi:hypothetical protein